jgi:hypothetical protein
VTWTYNPAMIQTTPLFQARFLIGDTIENDQQLADEEINFAMNVRSSIWGAAATCCFTLSAKLSRKADTVTGELHTLFSAQAKAYAARAAQYEDKSTIFGGGVPIVGGISVTEKVNQIENSDRVVPNFNLGMTDNFNQPLPPAGNENSLPNNGGNVHD